MHASSLENMQICYDTYVRGSFSDSKATLTVVDLGSADVNGTYRTIFNHPNVRYIGIDLAPGSGVDVIQEDPYHVPLPDGSADIVLSGQMLEHCECFWLSFQEMIRILKPDGLLFLIAPSTGEIHRYPVDCYRFYPDAYRALAKYAKCELLAVWRDHRDPWKDLVGVFSGRVASPHAEVLIGAATASTFEFSAPRAAEVTAGASDYLDVLRDVHAQLRPRTYLEIGVGPGNSLRLASTSAIGVDPAPNLSTRPPACASLFRETSDRFFREHAKSALPNGVDLGLIDGMHLFEYALRDFINLEAHSHPASVIIFDDILPNHSLQAARQRQTAVWTGDVWKIVPCLRKHRPDLLLLQLGSGPTGLLLVAGLDANSRILSDAYDAIVTEYAIQHSGAVPADVLQRTGVIDPNDSRIAFLLRELRKLRQANAACETVQQFLQDWHAALFDQTGSRVNPRLTEMRSAHQRFTRSLSWMISGRLRGLRAWATPYGTTGWRIRRTTSGFLNMWEREGLLAAAMLAGRKLMNRFGRSGRSSHAKPKLAQ